MKTLSSPGSFKQNYLFNFIWESPQYIFKFLQFSAIVLQLIEVVILPEKKMPIAMLILGILQVSATFSALRSRQKINQLLQKISCCSHALCLTDGKRKFRMPIIAYCCGLFMLNFFYLLMHFYSNRRTFVISIVINSPFFSFQLQEYILLLLDTVIVLNAITQSLVMTSLSGYYGFACFYVRVLLKKLELFTKTARVDNHQQVIPTYLKLVGIVKCLEDSLCFSAFVIVVSSISGLFHVNYSMLFVSIDGYLHYLIIVTGEIYFSTFLVMIIVPASVVNEALLSAKQTLISLPVKISQHANALTMVINGECLKEVSLTLWKIYKIRRSFIISAIGTLLSYGILVATFDTMKNPCIV
ncbi:uncharacterized protein TNCT_64711 [Trichonephila clavata]|uniref:Gustatory receptor n=1 Tax=Trichonephila clavata TaxID=2740835 RepID=A0A8X6L4C7_TRICU|nr:uncharacterized protein TNCT_64711 [Trichonephila clavata]